MFVIYYAGPIYLLGGILVSIRMDKLLEKFKNKSKRIRYLIRLVLYSLGGVVVSLIYLVFTFHDILSTNLLMALTLGLAAANLYFHLSLLLSYTEEKMHLIYKVK